MGDEFLRDQWYAAARSDEVEAKPLARKICNQDLVLFRGASGKIAILQDRCAHRMAPLSLGEVIGDEIRCGYHGACFDAGGNCTAIPSQRDLPIPPSIAVKSYPAYEAHGLVFVWLGDGHAIDDARIPSWMAKNTEPGWIAFHGYHHVKGNYQLVIDNLLDLTHLTYVHKATLAGPGIDETPMDVEVDGDTIRTSRVVKNVDPPLIQKAVRGLSGKVDRWQLSEFNAPMYVLVTIGMEPANTTDTLVSPIHLVLNSATPEDQTNTHYFWSAVSRTDDAELANRFFTLTHGAFDEDAAMIAAQQARINSAPAGQSLAYFRGDSAGAAARRIVRRRLDQQAPGDDRKLERRSSAAAL
jgi:phenylpropionate dioxygenase-like ring-hydroxylating dioxygenase large terminal subunit